MHVAHTVLARPLSCHNLLRSSHLSFTIPLRWRHNGRDSVSNHQPHHCLLNLLFRRRSKKTLKLRVTGFCVGNSPGTGEFPAQMASNAENVSIWWRHHAYMTYQICTTILNICILNKLVLIAVKFLIVSFLFGSAELDLELFQRVFITINFISNAKCLYVLPFICSSLLTLFVYVPATLNSDVIVRNSKYMINCLFCSVWYLGLGCRWFRKHV